MTGFIVTLISGAIAGWLAGKLMGSKHGLIINIVLGLVGGVIGGFICKLIGLTATGFIGGVLVSVLGACILIWFCKRI